MNFFSFSLARETEIYEKIKLVKGSFHGHGCKQWFQSHLILYDHMHAEIELMS